MRLLIKRKRNEHFEMNWQLMFIQGLIIFFTGFTFAFASVLKSEAVVMSAKQFSWLPVCGIIVLSLGVLECLDALFAKGLRDFIQRLNVGVLDVVVGTFLILGVSETVERLSLMIAVYLLVRSMVRMALAYVLRLPHPAIIVVCGMTCVVLGIMVWIGWPAKEGWFYALSINIEIACRGLVMMIFAFWLKDEKQIREIS